MTTREQLAFEKIESLLKMIQDDGESPSGELPPPKYLSALCCSHEIGQCKDVREMHKNESGPPEWASDG